MLALLVGLLVSVGYERLKTHPGCFEVQISAYYYTPVRDLLVGVLLAVGVCLLCLRGNTPGEDVSLNFAGMFAAISALVPTPEPCPNCSSTPYQVENLQANIGNHVITLLAIGLVALHILGRPAKWNQLKQRGRLGRQPALWSFGGACLVWLATALVLELARGSFDKGAHITAASLMFVCIGAVVFINAREVHHTPGGISFCKNQYAVIVVLMFVSTLGFGVAGVLGWKYGILGLEVGLLALFAAFWVIQTKELWDKGLRGRTRSE